MARLGLDDARRKFKEGYYADALWSVRHAHSFGAEEAEELLGSIEEKRQQYAEVLAGASREHSLGNYEKVKEILAEYCDKPGLEAARDLIARTDAARETLGKALDEARNSLKAGEFAKGVEACDRALQIQKDNEEAIALKKELEHDKIYDTAEHMAEEAFRSGRYQKAVELWEAILEADPETEGAEKYLERAKKAVRVQEVGRVIAIVIGALACAALYAFYRYLAG
jgi:tetratricopeptide (TPR) repeat protein